MSSANSLGTASPTATVPFTEALAVLRAAAEETRLRILALLAEGELSVSDLTDILGQSQPRISRHLKLLVESGLIERHREGAWAFFRLREAAAGFVEPLIRHVVDLGTGTGKMLALLAPRAGRATGLDSSHAMLSVARANLERAGLPRVDLRQGDLHAPPFGRAGFDLVVLHQVLHYLDDPARALREAARLVAPGGRLLVVDFAPHAQEHLRETQAHRRLGFAADQVTGWLVQAGLGRVESRDLAPDDGTEHPLTVTLWLAQDIAQDVAENLTQNAVSLRPAAPDERAVA
jgi:SAM-dependent methyltransferase